MQLRPQTKRRRKLGSKLKLLVSWSPVPKGYGNSTPKQSRLNVSTVYEATKAKLHADILVVDRDITSRKEKFGVELYGHLEAITSTQEFYVAVRSIQFVISRYRSKMNARG